MTRRTGVGPYALYVLSAMSVLVSGCDPDRLRPGPPSIRLEFPDGTVISSPDTVRIRVVATDPNGLDTVAVTLRDRALTLNARALTELVDFVFFEIEDSIPVGTNILVVGIAADLSGLSSRTSASLTVSQSATSP